MTDPEQRIQSTRKTCHIVADLLSDFEDVKEHRQVFQMEGKGADTNFTITQLANAKCFAAPPLTFTSVKAQTAITVHYIGPGMAGHPRIVHGGVIALIFDECCGQAATMHFEALALGSQGDSNNVPFERQPQGGVLAVTAQLSVDFKSPARADAIVVSRAVVDKEKSSDRKAAVGVQMWQADPKETDKLVVVASGAGLYIRPRANA